MARNQKQEKTSFKAAPRDAAFRRLSVGRNRRSGQALVEYVLLLVFLTTMSITVMRSLTRTTSDGFQVLSAEIEKSLVTGSFTFKGQDIHQRAWAK